MQEYGYFFNKYSRIRNKGDLYVSVTIRILMQISFRADALQSFFAGIYFITRRIPVCIK